MHLPGVAIISYVLVAEGTPLTTLHLQVAEARELEVTNVCEDADVLHLSVASAWSVWPSRSMYWAESSKACTLSALRMPSCCRAPSRPASDAKEAAGKLRSGSSRATSSGTLHSMPHSAPERKSDCHFIQGTPLPLDAHAEWCTEQARQDTPAEEQA